MEAGGPGGFAGESPAQQANLVQGVSPRQGASEMTRSGRAGDAARSQSTGRLGRRAGALNPGSGYAISGANSTGTSTAAFDNQSNSVHLRVENERPVYVRTGAFAQYTGSGFRTPSATTRRSLATAGHALLTGQEIGGERDRLRVTLEQSATNLPVAWIPAAIAASSVPGSYTITEDGTITAQSGSVPAGTSYTVERAPVTWSPEELRGPQDPPAEIAARYTQLPADTPDRVRALGEEVTADAETSYDAAAKIEAWLEANKRYSLNASHDRSEPVVEQFLFEMDAGYCTYFAASMTVLLRTQDVPSRFVTGYAPGETAGDNEYVYRAKYAHAWVEVWFDGVGWVRFDPTPSASRRTADATASGQPNPRPGVRGSPGEAAPETVAPRSVPAAASATGLDANETTGATAGRSQRPDEAGPTGSPGVPGTNATGETGTVPEGASASGTSPGAGDLPRGGDGAPAGNGTGALGGTPGADSGLSGTPDGQVAAARNGSGSTSASNGSLADASATGAPEQSPGGSSMAQDGDSPSASPSVPDGDASGQESQSGADVGTGTPVSGDGPTDAGDAPNTTLQAPGDGDAAGAGTKATPGTADATAPDGRSGNTSASATTPATDSSDDATRPTVTIATNRSLVPGARVRFVVSLDEQPVSGVGVLLDDEQRGRTDSNGVVVATVPYETTLTVALNPRGRLPERYDLELATPSGGPSTAVEEQSLTAATDGIHTLSWSGALPAREHPTARSDSRSRAQRLRPRFAAQSAPEAQRNAASGGTEVGRRLATTTHERSNSTVPLPTNATLTLRGRAIPNETVTVRAQVDDVAVKQGAVRVAGERVATTTSAGLASVEVPTTPGTYSVTVRRGPVRGNTSITVHPLSVSVTPSWIVPVPMEPVTVNVTRGDVGIRGAAVTIGTGDARWTGPNGTVAGSLPPADAVSVQARANGQTASTTVAHLYRNLGLVVAVLSALLVGIGKFLQRVVLGRLGDGSRRLWTAVVNGLFSVVSLVSRGARWLEQLVTDSPRALAVARARLGQWATLARRRLEQLPQLVANLPAILRALLADLRAELDDESDASAASLGARLANAVSENDEGAPDRTITDLWRRFLELVGVSQPATKTPGEIGRRGIDHGLPEQQVTAIVDAYRESEYTQDADESSLRDRAMTAYEALHADEGEGEGEESRTTPRTASTDGGD
jgi:transglutaminase-like putative cysteine protease